MSWVHMLHFDLQKCNVTSHNHVELKEKCPFCCEHGKIYVMMTFCNNVSNIHSKGNARLIFF